MKVHIGSGSVYLIGYLNIDVRSNNTFLACDRPDLLERYATTEDKYYARHPQQNQLAGFSVVRPIEYVCDKYGDFLQLPVATATATEILARQSFEHLSYTEAKHALSQIDNIMVPDGILRLDVPDYAETVKLLRETGDSFYERHLYGPRRDAHGYHVMSYTREKLIELVTSCGFTYQHEEPNIHPYPAFTLRFIKSVLPAPVDYVKLPWDLDKTWKIVDVGPGAYPHPRAHLYIDRDAANLNRIKLASWQHTYVARLELGLPEIPSKSYDYCWCSHVIEHMDDPAAAVATLSRIAKRGTIVVPSAIKEALFNFHEPDHKWMVLPQHNGPPVFVRRNGQYDTLIDKEAQNILYRFFQSGPNNHNDGHYIRNWYREHEKELDVVLHWTGEAKVMVIG